MYLTNIFKLCNKTYRKWKYERDMKYQYNRYKTWVKPRNFYRYKVEDYIFVHTEY